MSISDENTLIKCISDLKKMVEVEKLYKEMTYKYEADLRVDLYLKYVLNNNIIQSLEDVFYVVNQIPEISEIMSRAVHKYGFKNSSINIPNNANSYSNDPCTRNPSKRLSDYAYTYKGQGYDKIADIPGFHTEWNERCFPDGVTINKKNDRC